MGRGLVEFEIPPPRIRKPLLTVLGRTALYLVGTDFRCRVQGHEVCGVRRYLPPLHVASPYTARKYRSLAKTIPASPATVGVPAGACGRGTQLQVVGNDRGDGRSRCQLPGPRRDLGQASHSAEPATVALASQSQAAVPPRPTTTQTHGMHP